MGMHDEESTDFNEDSFASKVVSLPRWAGRTVLEQAFLLYELLRDPNVPVWAKAIIAAALALFVCPCDACPDILPLVGFTDDGVVMAGAIAQLDVHVREAHRKKARRRARELLGN